MCQSKELKGRAEMISWKKNRVVLLSAFFWTPDIRRASGFCLLLVPPLSKAGTALFITPVHQSTQATQLLLNKETRWL